MNKKTFARLLCLTFAVILLMSLCTAALAKYKTLSQGDQGDEVRVMQTALKRKGYYKGSVDGKYGPTTRKAVYKYQQSLGIKADGKAGDKTLTALYEGGSKAINVVDGRKASAQNPKDPQSLYYGSTGSRVQQLQKALRATGHFKGKVDGKYGELTELAVRKFQASKGLKTDGIAGKDTLARLNKAQDKVTIRTSFLMDIGSRGAEVKSLQLKLQGLGYMGDTAYPADASGVYGQATKSMVKEWQKANKEDVTGAMSEKQYNKLINTK